MRKLSFKSILSFLVPIIAIPAIATPIVLSNTHKTNKDIVSNFYSSIHNAKADSWDALMSLELQLENIQTSTYASANPTWTPAQIAAQVAIDDADFYNIYYKPTSSSDEDKDTCYNYLMQYANSKGFSLISWDYIQANEDAMVDQIVASNSKINKDSIKATLDDLISQGISNNESPLTFYNDAIDQILAHSSDKNAQKMYLQLIASKFTSGNFSIGSDENMADPEVEAFIENGATNIHLTSLNCDYLTTSVEEKFFTYTSNDQINPYVGDICNIPFLKDAGISIFQARAYPVKKAALDYKTILTDGTTNTNTMKLEFILEDSHGNQFTTDKMDYQFAYTPLESDFLFNRFMSSSWFAGGFGDSEMVNTKYNNLMYNDITNQYVPFDSAALSQNDTWYATYGNAANFNYSVGDELPDDITNHICQVSSQYFIGIDPNMSLTDTTSAANSYMTNFGIPEGRVVAKVGKINISIDDPYVDLDMYWKTNSGKEYLMKGDQITQIYAYGTEMCDHNRFSLYWDKDTLADLNLAATIANNNNIQQGIETLQKDSYQDAINSINKYHDWLIGYSVAETTLSAAFTVIAGVEAAAAVANFMTQDYALGAIMTALSAADFANGISCGFSSAYGYVNAKKISKDVKDLEALNNFIDSTNIVSDLSNLQDDINKFNNPTTFGGFVQSAEAVITDAQNFSDTYASDLSSLLNNLAKDGDFSSAPIDLSVFSDFTQKWMAIAFTGFSLSVAGNVTFMLFRNAILDYIGYANGYRLASLQDCVDNYTMWNEEYIYHLNAQIPLNPIWNDEQVMNVINYNMDQIKEINNVIIPREIEKTFESAKIDDIAKASSIAGIIVGVISTGIDVAWTVIQKDFSNEIAKEIGC